MRPTTLVLVRHGHVADNDTTTSARLNGWTDAPLTARGEAEARAMARRLAVEPPANALYTSTLVRARRTASSLPVRSACAGIHARRCARSLAG
jgi:broad specificity phosphatase PhoE